ncbi:hypothetical protein LTR16_007929 [Cryomyces antarcticus]|uniref:Uncharacterized protein n=1 Tax=Cryomyces antarcticus TaxID=329879 RepID=A0ABR0LKS5_9PEZI|nr:hypothetical protein LTR16_007929 [Cryomyces antarcticus]
MPLTLYETSTDGPRQRKSSPKPDSNGRAVTPNPLGAPSERQKRGVLDSFWRVVFGGWLAPFGRWFAALFGKERRATEIVVALALVVTFAVYNYQTAAV